ncbi:hypothetical protein GCM10027342_35460 [Photobacterium alginatilyticum]
MQPVALLLFFYLVTIFISLKQRKNKTGEWDEKDFVMLQCWHVNQHAGSENGSVSQNPWY